MQKLVTKIVLILLFPVFMYAKSVQVDVIDKGNGDSQFIITDLCNVKHFKTFSKKEVEDLKPLKWLQNLQNQENFNKCIDSK